MPNLQSCAHGRRLRFEGRGSCYATALVRRISPSTLPSSEPAQRQYCSCTRARKNSDVSRAARNRQESPLLRLPAELRNRIYTMVLQPERVLVQSRYLTAFDMTVELRSCCSSISTTKAQTWSDGNAITLLPVICRQLYEETHSLLYALNSFAFTDEQSMRMWISCRT